MKRAIVQDKVVISILPSDVVGPAEVVNGAVPCPEDVKEGWSWDGSQFAPPPAPLAPSLDDLMKAKTVSVREAYEAYLAPFRLEYGPTEIAGWDEQAQAAEAILAGTASPDQVALIQGLVQARAQVSPRPAEDLTVESQAQRIVSNRAAWSALYAAATGLRNGYQDLIDRAEQPEDLEFQVSFGALA